MAPTRWLARLAVGLLLTTAGPQEARAQARQGLLSLPEGRLFYEVVGAGDPIVVVHGGPGLDHGYLRPGLDVLAASHALVYYDQRGTGRSDVPIRAETINLDAFVQDIDDLRQVLGYERITVLGHSFGGMLALAYARAHPDATRALILLDTAEPGSRFAEETARRQAAARSPEDSATIAALMASRGFAEHDRETMARIYRTAFRGTMRTPDRVSELDLDLSERTAKNGPEVARLLGGSMEGFDAWGWLGELDMPALVLHGRYEPAPVAMAQALAGALPRGRFVALDSGHFPFVEDPQGLASAVSAFLAALGGG
jgi:proline iminopeptidase